MKRSRIWIAGLGIAALAALWAAQGSHAGDEKALAKAVDEIAASLRKGDKAGAQKKAEELAKNVEEIYDVMDLMRPRKKGGVGVGKAPGDLNPDGIEQMLLQLGRIPPGPATLKNADALEEMAYRIAAIAEVSIAKAPARDQGKKLKKDWVEWSKDMREASLELAAASKAKKSADIKTAAGKVNNSCNACHSIFR